MVTPPVTHILSVDVERWFDGNLHRRWAYQPKRGDARLPSELSALLDLLAEHRVRATFFVLGRVAADHPDLVRRIAAAGHEVACHGLEHELLRDMTADRYAADLHRARSLLQDLSGQPVFGHRAPSWSLDRGVPWAISVLLDAGFTYDSSVFPMRTPLYGEPGLPLQPHWLSTRAGERILELPPAVWRLGPLLIPYGGGLYWRVLPAPVIKHLLRHGRANSVAYLHPWELNPEPLEFPPELPPLQRVALRVGVTRARRRLAGLLQSVGFHPFDTAIPAILQAGRLPTACLEGDSPC